jgi:hypothetical protein
LALKKLFRQVLRPRIKLDYKEAKQYYQNHLSDFRVPERRELVVFTGPDPRILEAACTVDDPQGSHRLLRTQYPNVAVRSITVQEDKIPDVWRAALQGVKIGRSSKVISGDSGFECLMLQHVFPARTLSPMEAYPQVESFLIDKKLQAVFGQWLEGVLSTAHIEVADQLLHRESRERSEGASQDVQ